MKNKLFKSKQEVRVTVAQEDVAQESLSDVWENVKSLFKGKRKTVFESCSESLNYLKTEVSSTISLAEHKLSMAGGRSTNTNYDFSKYDLLAFAYEWGGYSLIIDLNGDISKKALDKYCNAELAKYKGDNGSDYFYAYFKAYLKLNKLLGAKGAVLTGLTIKDLFKDVLATGGVYIKDRFRRPALLPQGYKDSNISNTISKLNDTTDYGVKEIYNLFTSLCIDNVDNNSKRSESVSKVKFTKTNIDGKELDSIMDYSYAVGEKGIKEYDVLIAELDNFKREVSSNTDEYLISPPKELGVKYNNDLEDSISSLAFTLTISNTFNYDDFIMEAVDMVNSITELVTTLEEDIDAYDGDYIL